MPTTFPTLSKLPAKEGYRRIPLYDPTLRSRSDDGLIVTRLKHTRFPWQWWFVYRELPEADLETLDTFQETVGVGAEAFNWTDPVSGTTYVCRFAEPIDAKLETDMANVWYAGIHLCEAVGVVL
jgi:hypothetical protein